LGDILKILAPIFHKTSGHTAKQLFCQKKFESIVKNFGFRILGTKNKNKKAEQVRKGLPCVRLQAG
jgi:hypothetical protein